MVGFDPHFPLEVKVIYCHQNRKRHCPPQLQSPGNGGKTGIIVETLHYKNNICPDRQPKPSQSFLQGMLDLISFDINVRIILWNLPCIPRCIQFSINNHQDTKPTPKHLLTQTWWIRGCSAIIMMTPLNIQCLVRTGTLKPMNLYLTIQQTEQQTSTTHLTCVFYMCVQEIHGDPSMSCWNISLNPKRCQLSGGVRKSQGDL